MKKFIKGSEGVSKCLDRFLVAKRLLKEACRPKSCVWEKEETLTIFLNSCKLKNDQEPLDPFKFNNWLEDEEIRNL